MSTPRKLSTPIFTGFKQHDMRDATDDNLRRWHARIGVETQRRDEGTGKLTPRGQRMVMEE